MNLCQPIKINPGGFSCGEGIIKSNHITSIQIGETVAEMMKGMGQDELTSFLKRYSFSFIENDGVVIITNIATKDTKEAIKLSF